MHQEKTHEERTMTDFDTPKNDAVESKNKAGRRGKGKGKGEGRKGEQGKEREETRFSLLLELATS